MKQLFIGEKKIEVSRIFKISRNTLDLWLKKEKETGDYQASQNISYACRKLGITRKKKTYGYSERDEEKREEFIKKVAVCRKKKVDVDEAGFDKREDYPYG